VRRRLQWRGSASPAVRNESVFVAQDL